MGCINSKKVARTASPSFEYAAVKVDNGSVVLRPSSRNPSTILVSDVKSEDQSNRELKKFKKDGSFSFRLGISHRSVTAEQTSAGWPSWLCDFAGEAIHGWVPLRADSFEKMEKIGQGTYSSVFRAREIETGKIFALKKVRFDNFQPESIRFMAREIMIFRRLDHPNIMKLEGIVTSRSSNSIYLVFEYMEHDLAGLISCPDIQFSSAQVKCYMRQLLSAVEHCHLRGIMHRDIKVSNILVNNNGILKLGDFGLANILNPKNKQPLTSRVVTLWYRPPELLMGSTNYGLSVDVWSVGCVLAELYMGKPILKGRTEVEQLHKIFKLCGSPPVEYWKKAKLPHSTMFKPQNSYESSLRERCKDFPTSVVDLLETFLSIEPEKRGTASSALMSQYFRTEPYACDPSSLPNYPPQKELDAKHREDARRKKVGGKPRDHGAPRRHRRARKTTQETNILDKLSEDGEENSQLAQRNNDNNNVQTLRSRASNLRRDLTKASLDTVSEICPSEDTFQVDGTCSGPAPISASSGFTWAKRRGNDVTSVISDGSKSQFSALDPSFAMISYNWKPLNNELHTNCTGHDICEAAKLAMRKQQRSNYDMPVSFDESDFFKCQENQYQEEMIELSGPLLSQSARLDELLQRNESDIHIATRRSRFERGKNGFSWGHYIWFMCMSLCKEVNLSYFLQKNDAKITWLGEQN